jgi:hypothetical protein
VKKGYAGLLLEETSGVWDKDPVTAVRAFADYAISERRGLDLLETMPQIDAKRIGSWAGAPGPC